MRLAQRSNSMSDDMAEKIQEERNFVRNTLEIKRNLRLS